MRTYETTFLVIGSGIAGLTFALRVSEKYPVLVVTKSELWDTNTQKAQGGIAVAVAEDDTWELHEEDTLRAGGGLCDRKAVRFLVQNARPRMEWLISIGARFDPAGEESLPRLSLAQEGGHSRRRIVHRADQSGREIERALIEAVRKKDNIQLWEYSFCEALCMKDQRCTGAIIRPKDQPPTHVVSSATLLATGSCCQVYRFTTNPPIATGDGIALADAVGAHITHMEFIQFHPTTLYHRKMRGFLITEAVRGAGAILRTIHGRRFMFDYDPRGELAPRDIVARAIHNEILKEGVPFVHLDMTHLSEKVIKEQFPMIRETLLSLGIDITRDPIPVVPAAHYQCGGVVTDLNGRTNIPGLYAAGEVANTGVHGANRLASNSLLEALVFGYSAGEHAKEHADTPVKGEPVYPRIPTVHPTEQEGLTRRLRRIMWEKVGIVRSNRGLRHAEEELHEMRETLRPAPDFFVKGREAANMLQCGLLITQQARERKFNVGLHYNVDLPPMPAEEALPKEV
jgi:L-aspartate oxidase